MQYFVDEALFNGCSLVTSDEVKAHAQKLAQWTTNQVLEGLRNSVDPEAYHLEVFQDDENYLIEQFEKLVAFYQEAAATLPLIVSQSRLIVIFSCFDFFFARGARSKYD